MNEMVEETDVEEAAATPPPAITLRATEILNLTDRDAEEGNDETETDFSSNADHVVKNKKTPTEINMMAEKLLKSKISPKPIQATTIPIEILDDIEKGNSKGPNKQSQLQSGKDGNGDGRRSNSVLLNSAEILNLTKLLDEGNDGNNADEDDFYFLEDQNGQEDPTGDDDNPKPGAVEIKSIYSDKEELKKISGEKHKAAIPTSSPSLKTTLPDSRSNNENESVTSPDRVHQQAPAEFQQPGARRISSSGTTESVPGAVDMEDAEDASLAEQNNNGVAVAQLPESAPDDSETVHAKAVDDADLEKEIRQRIVEEAVEAEIHQGGFWSFGKVMCLLIFIAVVGLVGGLLGRRNKNSKDQSNIPSTNDPPGTNSPSDSPSAVPTISPSSPPTFSFEAVEIMNILKDSSFDDGEALNDTSSPQYRAFLWLISENDDINLGQLKQRHAMATLFYSLGGENWFQTDDWLSEKNECEWSSATVQCDLSNNIVRLFLQANNMKGTIPRELGFLSRMESLTMNDNALSGSTPSEFLNLVAMTNLDLSRNFLIGTMPFTSRFSVLAHLRLSGNNFNDTLQSDLGYLTSLETLDLSENLGISGSIPEELNKLTRLQELDLSLMSLSGEIPESVFAANTGLRVLKLAGAGVEGTLPASIGKLSRLEQLDISDNNLTGPFPDEFRMVSSLKELYFSRNHLNGTFPEFFTLFENLEQFVGTQNDLSSTLPTTISNMRSLENFEMHANKISGTLPTEIGLMSGLLEFKVGTNLMTGRIPTQIGNLTQLKRLFINTNNFSGQLPTEIGLMVQCTSLVVHTNDFTGTLPAEIFNLDLRMIQLDKLKGITGTLPTTIGNLISMSRVRITATSLTGSLPTEFGRLTGVRQLKIEDNKFSGELPTELGNMENLSEFSVYDNMFSGTIPESLTELNFLTTVSFAMNNFTGSVPVCGKNLELVVGDCEEVVCPCCTTCCVDGELCDTPPIAGKAS